MHEQPGGTLDKVGRIRDAAERGVARRGKTVVLRPSSPRESGHSRLAHYRGRSHVPKSGHASGSVTVVLVPTGRRPWAVSSNGDISRSLSA